MCSIVRKHLALQEIEILTDGTGQQTLLRAVQPSSCKLQARVKRRINLRMEMSLRCGATRRTQWSQKLDHTPRSPALLKRSGRDFTSDRA